MNMKLIPLIMMVLLGSGLALGATSGTTDVSAVVGNTAPTITAVPAITAQDPTEDSTTSVAVKFTADDTNGVADLNDSTASATLSKSGETDRTASCSVVDVDSTSANYTCNVDMYYFDGSGADWIINVSVQDVAVSTARNDTEVLTYNTLKAIKVGPTSIAFGSVSIGQLNIGATDDPVKVNNTGNVDIASGNVNVTAYNLKGTTTTTEKISASQFTVNIADASEGDALANGTTKAVTSSIVTAGNHTVDDGATGQEYLYYYLEEVPAGISAQTYDTSALGAWVVSVI